MRFRTYFCTSILAFLTGCAGVSIGPGPGQKPSIPSAPLAAPRQLIIYIPQTDQAAGSWLKLFEKHPHLRMTVAVSPRFQRLTKEPLLKEKIQALQKAGRLEFALQLPNAPFLPLLINTDSAHAALPSGTPLPAPPFVRPEDATQIVAKSKAEFYKQWGIQPKGFVVPQGAMNGDVLKLLSQLGFVWVVGAAGAPGIEGVYRSGSLLVYDATPIKESPRFSVMVWDERQSGDPAKSMQMLNLWSEDLLKKHLTPTLPSDPDIPVADLPAETNWGNRTWTTKDWSPWIGTAHKNSAWNWLRTTREALDRFKNSGQASVRRLDMAFEEIYNAENANYFSGITEGETTFNLAEDREREFKATLSSVYRLIGENPPDNLFSTENTASIIPGFKASSTTLSWESLPDGRGHLTINDAAGDDKGDGHLTDPAGKLGTPGAYDLRQFELWVTSATLDGSITLSNIQGGTLGNFQNAGPLIDLYIDLNGASGVGTGALLPGRGAMASPTDAWEYALVLWGSQGHLYATRGGEMYDNAETVPLTFQGNRIRFSMPRSWIRGNPKRWGYQVLVMAYDQKSLESDVRPLTTPDMSIAHRLPIYDLIDPLDIPQAPLLTGIEEGKRNDIPFLRVQSSR